MIYTPSPPLRPQHSSRHGNSCLVLPLSKQKKHITFAGFETHRRLQFAISEMGRRHWIWLVHDTSQSSWISCSYIDNQLYLVTIQRKTTERGNVSSADLMDFYTCKQHVSVKVYASKWVPLWLEFICFLNVGLLLRRMYTLGGVSSFLANETTFVTFCLCLSTPS